MYPSLDIGLLGGFNPLQINPKFWLDATDVNALSLSGTDVISMLDKSGNGNDFPQSTPANRPVVDSASNPTKVTYDGVGEYLDGSANIGNFTGDTQGTFVVVIRNTVEASHFNLTESSGAGQSRFDLGISSIGKIQAVWYNGVTIQRFTSSNGVSAGDVICLVSNASELKMYINNIEETIVVVNGTNNGSWIANVTTGTLNTMRIGSLYLASVQYFYGLSKSESLYFGYALTATQRTNLFNYLRAKHNL